jgi:predicted nuclease of predicted toxin-antitoxin system
VAGYLADECVAGAIVQRLRSLGLDVTYAKELCRGSPDTEVLALATRSGRVLITHDLGFGELAIRLGQPAAGVVILSVYALPVGMRERYAAQRIRELGCGAVGHLVVIEPGRVRRRPLPEPPRLKAE